MSQLSLYGQSIDSRLFLGTSRYPSLQTMNDAIRAGSLQNNLAAASFGSISLIWVVACCQTLPDVTRRRKQ